MIDGAGNERSIRNKSKQQIVSQSVNGDKLITSSLGSGNPNEARNENGKSKFHW